MSTLADFGDLTHAVSLDRGIIAFLQKWLPTYLHATERREGKPTSYLARPASYATVYDEDDEDFFSDRRLPCVFVTTGEATNWTRDGDGVYSAIYRTRITVVGRGRNKGEARYLAALNIATVTELLIGRPALGGIAGGVSVVSERPRPILDPSNRTRNLAAGFGEYAIFVPAVRYARSGPIDADPPTDPTTDLDPMPDVSEVDVDFAAFHSPPTSLES